MTNRLLSPPPGVFRVRLLQKESGATERDRHPTHHLTRDAYQRKPLRQPELSYLETPPRGPAEVRVRTHYEGRPLRWKPVNVTLLCVL